MARLSARDTARHVAQYAEVMTWTVTVQRKTSAVESGAPGRTWTWASVTNLISIPARIMAAQRRPLEQGNGTTQLTTVGDWDIDIQEFDTEIKPQDRIVDIGSTPNVTYEVRADLGHMGLRVHRTISCVRVQ